MTASFVAEMLVLAGTILVAAPALRLSLKLSRLTKTANVKPGDTLEVADLRAETRDVLHKAAQMWNPLDHWCLALGVLLQIAASIVHLWDLFAR